MCIALSMYYDVGTYITSFNHFRRHIEKLKCLDCFGELFIIKKNCYTNHKEFDLYEAFESSVDEVSKALLLFSSNLYHIFNYPH